MLAGHFYRVANRKRHGEWREYALDVPDWLHPYPVRFFNIKKMGQNKFVYVAKADPDGKATIPAALIRDIKANFAGKEFQITLERKYKKRSSDQNAYYWGVIIRLITLAINEQQGENYSETQVHEFLKFRYLKIEKIDESTGELIFTATRSTSDLKTWEFALYIEQCIQFASVYLGIAIPTPWTSRGEYEFPEYPKMGELRADYLIRLRAMLLDVDSVLSLITYYRYNPEWAADAEYKALFTKRKIELQKA